MQNASGQDDDSEGGAGVSPASSKIGADPPPSLLSSSQHITKRFRCFGKTSSCLLLMRIIRRMRVSAVRMRIIVERIRMRIMGSLCICLSVVTALRAKTTQYKTLHRDLAPQNCLQKGSGKTIVG